MADSKRKTALLNDNPLCGISTYKDSLNLATGVCMRKIYKLVLHGTESYGKNASGTYQYYMAVNPLHKKVPICVCSHLPSVDDYPTDVIGVHTTRWANNAIYLNFGEDVMLAQPSGNTVAGLKEYITAQYNAGTPVTIWYILETPTTETVTIPSGLTGTEEGYLIQDGTPTPTNPIYPTANNVEIWQHSLRKLTTATEAVENPLYSDGTAITAYTLKGNTVQNGTPTPQNPIQPQETGERTENLVPSPLTPKSETVNGLTFNVRSDGIVEISGTAAEATIYSYKLKTPFTMPTSKTAGGNAYLYYWNTFISGGTIRLKYNNQQVDYWSIIPVNRVISKFDNAENATIDEIEIRIPSGETINGSIGIMVTDNGEIANAYEPYGYKIPISSGGVTTNIYLGSTQTVRAIKSKVIPSDYSPITATAITNGTRFELTGILGVNSLPNQGLCTHAVYSTGWNTFNAFSISRTNGHIYMARNDISTVEEFREWLADQSANGTPVTVWYVLATPETGIVNEPLMKIGTYADTLSNATAIPTTEGANSITVDTTVQPSEFTATWTGWHDSSVKEWDGSDWQ